LNPVGVHARGFIQFASQPLYELVPKDHSLALRIVVVSFNYQKEGVKSQMTGDARLLTWGSPRPNGFWEDIGADPQIEDGTI